MKKAVLIDKDGTLIHDVPYNVNPTQIRLTDGAIEGLKKITRAGFEIFIVSNQQGVGLGYFTEDELVPVKMRLNRILGAHGISLQGFYYCPHNKDDKCLCHKPQPGILKAVSHLHNIDLTKSWMIGDILSDIEAGNRVGSRTILVDKGYENKWIFTKSNMPEITVKNLDQAAEYIISRPF